MIEKIRIPEKRMPILIGKGGEVKKNLEKMTQTKINITDEITVHGDALNVMDTCNIIKAIGRGFDPESALELINEEMNLCVIPLPDDRKILKRIKSRIIGTRGKCRKTIEKITKTKISVYGKTVAIIGEYEAVETARCAIEKIITGSPHSHVYKFIEKMNRSTKGASV